MSSENQKNILLVEDEALIGMAESMKLKEYGYYVIHVLNGQDAIDAVFKNEPPINLILMDIDLGKGMYGTEAATIILKKFDIPIVFLSSHLEREIVEKTELISSYGYIVKNSGITVLDASIKMALRLHDSHKNVLKQNTEIETINNNLQLSEKRYRRLFESAKDGILILDAVNGKIVDVNPYLIKILGYSKEIFLEKSIWEINAFKNIEYSKELFKELQEKEYVRYTDLPLETFDGNLIHVEFVSNVYFVDTKKVIQCNIRDTTERIRYEKSLTNNIDEKDSLLKEIQHRTKNSFNMITSLIQLSSRVTQSEETNNILKELTLKVNSISDLYLLLYETNTFQEVRLDVYCNKVIDSTLKLSNSIMINKSLEFVTVSPKNAAAIGMILVELLTNIIKYAYPDSINGIINIEMKIKNSKIILMVKDNGIGLQNDFDITKIKSIGLHLVSLMVDQLSGSMTIMSENGTKIIIECPI